MSVDGPLANWSNKMFKNILRDSETGEYISPEMARKQFELWRFEGKRVVPMSDECEGFSFETGCPGHEKTTSGE